MTVVLVLVTLAAGAWLLDRISAAPTARAVPVSRRFAEARRILEVDAERFEQGSIEFR